MAKMLLIVEDMHYRFHIKVKPGWFRPKVLSIKFKEFGSGSEKAPIGEGYKFLGCYYGSEYGEGEYDAALKKRIRKDLRFHFRTGGRIVLLDKGRKKIVLLSEITGYREKPLEDRFFEEGIVETEERQGKYKKLEPEPLF